ncbi:MAG: HupE/UreJ family protein [Cellvibrionaceae bacterium]
MKFSLPFFILLLFTFPAQAHEGGAVGGFVTGLLHPVLGFDHLLAMVSVGILSGQLGGKAIWTVPFAFVLMMLMGGLIGMQEIALPLVEIAIGASVLCLGIAIAAYKKFPFLLMMIFVGFFAIFHGHAHGTEMPYISDAVFYSLGFVVGTTFIHIVGLAISWLITKLPSGKNLLRYFGAGIAGVGFAILFIK